MPERPSGIDQITNVRREIRFLLRLLARLDTLTMEHSRTLSAEIGPVILLSFPTFLFLPSSDPKRLVVVYGIGVCTGISLFFCGLRSGKQRPQILDKPVSAMPSASADMVSPQPAGNPPDKTAPLQAATSSAQPATSPSAAASYEVIRLTPESSPPLHEMSQQQKVAAALVKAGIANPAGWRSTAHPVQQVEVDTTSTFSRAAGSGTNGNDSKLVSREIDGFDPHPPALFTKGSHDKAFLIPWRTQLQATRSFEWKVRLLLWGGPTLALLCLYLILSAEHLL